MGVARERQTEMSLGLGAVIGLGLAAQDDLVQEIAIVLAGLRQDSVKDGRAHDLTARQVDFEGSEKAPQALDLLKARFLVDPVDTRRMVLFEAAGGGHIGRDHELIDQAVRIEARPQGHRSHMPVLSQLDPAFGQFQIQRLAALAGRAERRIGRIEGLQMRLDQRLRIVIELAFDGLGVIDRRGGSVPGPLEALALQVALGVDPQMGGHGRAVDPGHQRTKIGRQALGQHPHHPVGEIAAVAAPSRRLVEGRAGPHIM